MRFSTLFMGLCLFSCAFSAVAEPNLYQKTQQVQQQQAQSNRVRESQFQTVEADTQAKLNALLAQKATLDKQVSQLRQTFTDNAKNLAILHHQLQSDSESLADIFSEVRQSAQQLKTQLITTNLLSKNKIAAVDSLVTETTLPSLMQVSTYWQTLTDAIRSTRQVTSIAVPFVNGSGERSTITVDRLGAFGLIGEDGYLAWNAKQGFATLYSELPNNVPTLSQLQQSSDKAVVLDPAQGELLTQWGSSPTLWGRLQEGGLVGYVIVVLLFVGLGIASYRLWVLQIINQQIQKQLHDVSTPMDNPLGRIFKVYHSAPNRSVDVLELKLLEAVMDEQESLETGLPMLKLFAALAPMLGLLGTVIGMIETFQVITQMGNGDPKVMASGISMALVTTVLGLIAAMPLLLAHNLLSSRVDRIRHILEKQGIGLVAEQAEQQALCSTVTLSDPQAVA